MKGGKRGVLSWVVYGVVMVEVAKDDVERGAEGAVLFHFAPLPILLTRELPTQT